MKLYKNLLTAVALTALATSCVDEIEHGTTDIDSWPVPKMKVDYPETFTHPGVIFDQTDIDRWRDIVATTRQPQYAGFEVLRDDPKSSPGYMMQGPFDMLSCGFNDEHPTNDLTKYAADFDAAIQCAVMYAATGQQPYADKSMEIIRAYATTVARQPLANLGGGGRQDNVLAVGNVCAKLVYAMELMRSLPGTGWTAQDFADCRDMCDAVFIPVLEKYFWNADESNPDWKNWIAIGNFGGSAMNCYAAMGVFLDRPEMFKYAIERYLGGHDNGSIRYYVDGATGQCQESGRDQTHSQLGLGMLSMLCEGAWKQGVDIYCAMDNRLRLGYEYTAKYNLGMDVPFSYMPNLSIYGTLGPSYMWYSIDQVDNNEVATGQRAEGRRGKFSPVYERVYNHYVTRKGMEMPYVKQVLDQKLRPEGNGAPDVAHLGFGTFLYNSTGY